MFKNIIRLNFKTPINYTTISRRNFLTYSPLLNESTTPITNTTTSTTSTTTASTQSTQSTTDINKQKKANKKLQKIKILKYVLHCNFKKNNTFLTLNKVEVDRNYEINNPELTFNEKVLYYLTLKENVVISMSTGHLGFRKSQRGEYEGAFQLSSEIFKSIREKNLLLDSNKSFFNDPTLSSYQKSTKAFTNPFDGIPLEIVVKEFGKGRKAFFDALQGKEGLGIKEHVTKFTDLTPIKYGGVRAPSRRRI